MEQGGNLLAAYPAGSLKDKVPLDGALPGAKAAEKEEHDQGGEVEEVAALGGSEMALLTIDGRLARVDAANGALLTRPIPAHPDPDRSGTGTLDDIFTEGRLRSPSAPPRAGRGSNSARRRVRRHPAVGPSSPRHIATLSGLPISAPFVSSDDPSAGPLVFDERGSRLAVQTSGRKVRVWDVDRGKQLPGSATSSSDGYMIGVGAGDKVLTYKEGQVTIHDLTDAENSTTLHVPDGAEAFVQENRLEVLLGGVQGSFTLRRRTFDLRPEAQFRALCKVADRDYTTAERELLPDGTPAQPLHLTWANEKNLRPSPATPLSGQGPPRRMIRMNDSQDFALSDGTTVHFLIQPAERPTSDAEQAPDGIGPLVPVARRRRAAAAVAADALRTTLQPLGSLVQDVHDAITTGATPPDEVSVTFGVQLGHDLKLGIVSGSGQAHLTVTATWKPEQNQASGA